MHKRLQMGAMAAVVAATLAAAPVGQAAIRTTTQGRRLASRSAVGGRRGRPRKFSRPSRAVTLTLPDDVIAALQTIDTDLSLAVVRMAQSLVPEVQYPPAELASYGGRAVIIVPRSQQLKERTGVELVPLTDGRALMAFDDGLSISQLELRIGDALADVTIEGPERAMFQSLADILKNARRSERVEVRERNIIVLQSTKAGGDGVVAVDEEPKAVTA